MYYRCCHCNTVVFTAYQKTNILVKNTWNLRNLKKTFRRQSSLNIVPMPLALTPFVFHKSLQKYLKLLEFCHYIFIEGTILQTRACESLNLSVLVMERFPRKARLSDVDQFKVAFQASQEPSSSHLAPWDVWDGEFHWLCAFKWTRTIVQDCTYKWRGKMLNVKNVYMETVEIVEIFGHMNLQTRSCYCQCIALG